MAEGEAFSIFRPAVHFLRILLIHSLILSDAILFCVRNFSLPVLDASNSPPPRLYRSLHDDSFFGVGLLRLRAIPLFFLVYSHFFFPLILSSAHCHLKPNLLSSSWARYGWEDRRLLIIFFLPSLHIPPRFPAQRNALDFYDSPMKRHSPRQGSPCSNAPMRTGIPPNNCQASPSAPLHPSSVPIL